MSAASTSFQKVDVKNFLGIQHKKFQAQIVSLALTQPSVYAQMKADTEEKLVNLLVEDIYNVIYAFLTDGKDPKNNSKSLISYTLPNKADVSFACNYPQHFVNEECLSIATSIHEIVSDLVEKIMPSKVDKLTNSRLAQLGHLAPEPTEPVINIPAP
jgi:hypothetical protein